MTVWVENFWGLQLTAITVGGTAGVWIRACVLLLLAERPTHGYELLENLEELGVHSADSGTLYRVLRRTERDGLTESTWEEAGTGPARRVYSLSGAGHEALADTIETLNEAQQSIRGFLSHADHLSSPTTMAAEPTSAD